MKATKTLVASLNLFLAEQLPLTTIISNKANNRLGISWLIRNLTDLIQPHPLPLLSLPSPLHLPLPSPCELSDYPSLSPFLRVEAPFSTSKWHVGYRKTDTKCGQWITVTWEQHSPQTGVPVVLTAVHHCCGSVDVDAGVGVGVGDDADDSRNA